MITILPTTDRPPGRWPISRVITVSYWLHIEHSTHVRTIKIIIMFDNVQILIECVMETFIFGVIVQSWRSFVIFPSMISYCILCAWLIRLKSGWSNEASPFWVSHQPLLALLSIQGFFLWKRKVHITKASNSYAIMQACMYIRLRSLRMQPVNGKLLAT